MRILPVFIVVRIAGISGVKHFAHSSAAAGDIYEKGGEECCGR